MVARVQIPLSDKSMSDLSWDPFPQAHLILDRTAQGSVILLLIGSCNGLRLCGYREAVQVEWRAGERGETEVKW